ncbi:hypothetical protein MPL1032_140141 [Mesorhizobium plurifarium]|uniref:Uncharacterized protein n=1 Tax=Mesorhizobium plurifarium TaxID=69974 RepID=A0A0K2VS96_MESPL|nr:hypothetical protein MPL1032_140141 [Mesorhizobium plurifarium]
MGRKWAIRATTGRLFADVRWQRPTKTPPRQAGRRWNAACGIVSCDKAETGSGHGAGLARHGLGEALTLQSGRQVHFAAGEQAGKELHHPSPLGCSDGSPSLDGVGQLVFAAADIGSLQQKLNRKNEALDMKSDMICDILGQCAHYFLLFTAP